MSQVEGLTATNWSPAMIVQGHDKWNEYTAEAEREELIADAIRDHAADHEQRSWQLRMSASQLKDRMIADGVWGADRQQVNGTEQN